MLEIQKYLQDNTLEDLKNNFGIKTTFHEDGRVILNYHQIDSYKHKYNPIVLECRGLVLDRNNNFELVARSFPRFFNLGEHRESQDRFVWEGSTATDKEDGCFGYNTQLNIWGGGKIKIGEVVSKKLKPVLVGLDKNGNLVPCEITDWHNNGKKDNWLDIFTNNNKTKLRVTTNHSINLNNEWKPAINAKIGDSLISYCRCPDQKTSHLIRSSLLGDGYLQKNGSGARFDEFEENWCIIKSLLVWDITRKCFIRVN